MNVNRFNIVTKEFTDHEEALLEAKRADYARGDQDCLINFKEASAALGMDPQLYCMTLFMKHVHSILMTVRQGGIKSQDWFWSNPQGEGMKQRISDARNFLVILAALVQEGEDHITIKDDEEP